MNRIPRPRVPKLDSLGRAVSAAAVAICPLLGVAGCGSAGQHASRPGTGSAVLLVSIPAAANAQRTAAEVATVPGVAATTPLFKTVAYLGATRDRVYAIDPASFAAAIDTHGFSTHADAGGAGGPAPNAAITASLRSHTDAAFVSRRRVRDYQLKIGDMIRLRLPDQHSQLHPASFHLAGISGSFPSTGGPEIVVANLAYIERISGANGPNALLVKVTGDPTLVARRVANATKADRPQISINPR